MYVYKYIFKYVCMYIIYVCMYISIEYKYIMMCVYMFRNMIVYKELCIKYVDNVPL